MAQTLEAKPPMTDTQNEPGWLYAQRAQAANVFQAQGFPTRRDEEFRFTPVTPIAETVWSQAQNGTVTPAEVDAYSYQGLTGPQLVFVDGLYRPELSRMQALPAGVVVSPLTNAVQEGQAEAHLNQYTAFGATAFTVWNTSAWADGAFVHVPANAVVDVPIHLLYITSRQDAPVVSHPRSLFVSDAHSQVTLVETYAGPEGVTYLTNAVTECILGDGANVDHYKVQRESLRAYHVGSLHVQLSRASNFTSHAITLGGSIVRNDANSTFNGEGAECTLNGLYRANGRQLIDNHTAIDHAKAHCDSHEVYKGILGGHARGVFNGKIFVREDAQKTDAKQTNQTLLLSGDAQINTKPQLEIFADDVKCTHGATIGQLSADALFYLRARGIPETEARALLVYAFASDIVSRIKVEAVRAHLDRVLLEERELSYLQ